MLTHLQPFQMIVLLTIQDAAQEPSSIASEFHAQFEAAFDAEDLDQIEDLVRGSPTQFQSLFEQYAKIWIGVVGEPSAQELLALERARTLAESVDSVFEASGLLQFWEHLEMYDQEDRRAWTATDTLFWSTATTAAGSPELLEPRLIDCAQAIQAAWRRDPCWPSLGRVGPCHGSVLPIQRGLEGITTLPFFPRKAR